MQAEFCDNFDFFKEFYLKIVFKKFILKPAFQFAPKFKR